MRMLSRLQLKPAARIALELGLNASILLLGAACCLLFCAGPLTSATISLHLLSDRLQAHSVGTFFLGVVLSGLLQERT